MSSGTATPARPYQADFLREVEREVEGGEWVRMCMQCGVCAGSCPFGPHWEHSPQKIFMMIRAGQREQVLTSESMWMCTSCYNCVVRCPRELPITTIMHGLASYAHRLGLAPRMQPMEILGGHRCKDSKGIEAMLAKVQQIEQRGKAGR